MVVRAQQCLLVLLLCVLLLLREYLVDVLEVAKQVVDFGGAEVFPLVPVHRLQHSFHHEFVLSPLAAIGYLLCVLADIVKQLAHREVVALGVFDEPPLRGYALAGALLVLVVPTLLEALFVAIRLSVDRIKSRPHICLLVWVHLFNRDFEHLAAAFKADQSLNLRRCAEPCQISCEAKLHEALLAFAASKVV